jgi:hypothetical protein
MRPRWTRLAAALATMVSGAGCFGFGGSKYLYGPLGAVVAQPKPKGCEFLVVPGVPVRAYDSLGVLAPLDIETPKAADSEAAFKSAVGAQVCEAGGDAVLVERNADGRFIRGTVIRLR